MFSQLMTDECGHSQYIWIPSSSIHIRLLQFLVIFSFLFEPALSPFSVLDFFVQEHHVEIQNIYSRASVN